MVRREGDRKGWPIGTCTSSIVMISEEEDGLANQTPSQQGLNSQLLEREQLEAVIVQKMKKKKSKRSSRSNNLTRGVDESESSDRKNKKKEKKKKKRLAREMESTSSLLKGTNYDEDDQDSTVNFDFEESLRNVEQAFVSSQSVTGTTNSREGIHVNDDLNEEKIWDDLVWGPLDLNSPLSLTADSKPQTDSSAQALQAPLANAWSSSSVAVSMENGSKLFLSPKMNKQSIMDDLASFAGASLGASMDGASDILSLAGSVGTNDSAEVVSHELLVGYMVSMGASRQEAESLAFTFTAQQSMTTSRARATSSRDITVRKTPPASLPNRGIMSASTSKLNRSMRSMVREDISTASATSFRRHRNYVRADAPGAVEMEGRAFGAPIRFPSRYSVLSEEAAADNVPEYMVEAQPVEQEEEREIVFADTSPLPVKVLCTKGPVRRVVISSVLLLAAAIAIMCYFLISASRAPPASEEQTTMSPSSSPTFITDSILDVAITLSGEDLVRAPNSPQFRAVGWLSTKDRVDHEDYDSSFVQRYVIVTFFYATNGVNWLEKDNWLNPLLHECEWGNGISCSTDIANRLWVDGIDLTRNGLTGYIPDEIGLLDHLAFLKLSKNTLSGTLPSSLGRLTRLVNMDLSSNQINGLLPHDFGNATALDTLSLSYNLLSGGLPSSLWNLNSLRILDLRSNTLMGTISKSINQLTKLVSLDLGMNSFTGLFPRNISALQKLDFFLLDYNKFTGSIPPLEAGFAKTLEISLAHNLLTGPLPSLDASTIAELLRTLRVSKLDISGNFLTGTINPAVSFLSTLKSFNASGNKFVDEFPTAGGWPSIEILSAANNFFTGTISTVWPQGLRHFDMSGNYLNGSLPTELCELSSLEFLLLSSNSLEGSIPTCYTGMSSLRAMEIASARLHGPIPDSINQLRYLNVLDISNNTLTGSIPTTMGLMSKLNQLSVDNNSLSSALPSDLGNLSLLYKLHLSNNDFVGTIPTSLGGLSGLESITLVGNELSGPIPNEWCQLSTIKLSAREVGCDLNCPCCFDSTEVCG